MKHHVKSNVLKDFKKILWNLKLKPINFSFSINDKLIEEHKNEVLINYGCVPNYELIKKDKQHREFYNFRLNLKKKPLEEYYITSINLSISYLDENTIKLSWKSLKGESKSISIGLSKECGWIYYISKDKPNNCFFVDSKGFSNNFYNYLDDIRSSMKYENERFNIFGILISKKDIEEGLFIKKDSLYYNTNRIKVKLFGSILVNKDGNHKMDDKVKLEKGYPNEE